MTREEFESILEEAYIEGYNSAIEDIEEDILDEEAYDLEGEYEYYTETKTDTKADKIRKAAIKGAGILGKELGFSPKTLSSATRASLAATSGNMDPKTRAKQVAKNIGKTMTGLVKDREKVGKTIHRTGTELMGRAAEVAPYEKELDSKSLQKKGEIGRRLLSGTVGKYKKIMGALTGNNDDEKGMNRRESEREQRKYIGRRIKQAIERKLNREKQAEKNRKYNERSKKEFPSSTPLYTKSGKYYNDNGKQGSRAVY